MKTLVYACLFAGLLSAGTVLGAQDQGGRGPQPKPQDTIVTAGIPGVVRAGTVLHVMKTGFNGTEGPIADKDGNLLFTEQNANKIIKVDPQGNFSTFLENTNRTIGIGWDSKGRLVSAESAPGKIALGVLYPIRQMLVNAYQGVPIGRVNDVVVDKKDGIYFPDAVLAAGQSGTPSYHPCLWYYTPDKKLIKITEDIGRPNGLILSPDGKVLYADDAGGDFVRAYDVKSDGTVGAARNFGRLEVGAGSADRTGRGDGMTIDADGRVYVATPMGVQLLSPEGKHLGRIPIPGQTQSVAFAGPGKKTLYVVGGGTVYRIDTLTHGLPYPAK